MPAQIQGVDNCTLASQVAQWVKNLPANAGAVRLVPGLGGSPGEGNGNPFQSLALEIPWTEEPGGLQSMGCKRVGDNLATKTTAANCTSLVSGCICKKL